MSEEELQEHIRKNIAKHEETKMTNEEAIEIIKEMLNEGDMMGDIRSTDERDVALKLAIRALEDRIKEPFA